MVSGDAWLVKVTPNISRTKIKRNSNCLSFIISSSISFGIITGHWQII
jgi:hypothetical protein